MAPPPRKTTPQHLLARVQGAAGACFIGKNTVREAATALGCDDAAAERFIRKVIASLRPDEYCYSEVQYHSDGDYWGDIYGHTNANGNWFVKFVVARQTVVCSCHPPRRPLKRKNGTILR